MARAVNERLAQPAARQHLARRRVDGAGRQFRAAPPQSRRHAPPARPRKSCGRNHLRAPAEPCASNPRSIRRRRPRSPAPPRRPAESTRLPGRACGRALLGPDATIVSNAGFEKPARRSASSTSKATSVSDRPGRTAARASIAAAESIRAASRMTSISPSSLIILARSTTRSVVTKPRRDQRLQPREPLEGHRPRPRPRQRAAPSATSRRRCPLRSSAARARRGGRAARRRRRALLRRS